MSPLFRRGLIWLAGLAGLLLALLLLPGKVSIWIDDSGHTYLTDRLGSPNEGAIELEPGDLSVAWGGETVGARPSKPGPDAAERVLRTNDPYTREVLEARDDVRRGELRSGLRTLRRLHRQYPGRPEAAWLLAIVERRRGRLESARDALASALHTAARMPPNWRRRAEALRGEIEAEIVHAQSAYMEGERIEVTTSEHFRLSYDHHFAGRRFGDRVLELLATARERLAAEFDATLAFPLEVRLYTKADYLQQYKHRFGFATVGFYDGAIHVVSARQPRGELLPLLIHEYAHAIFEDALGGHQPFFLNEGIADGEEEHARGRKQLSRGEWRRLLEAQRAEGWIPLASLVRDFGGVKGKRALLAYLESRGAVELIGREHPGAMARWLARCASGEPWEDALRAETGWDVAALETALLVEVASRFPDDPLALADGSRGAGAAEADAAP